jgi:V8-like Glu-specific endopeptidase
VASTNRSVVLTAGHCVYSVRLNAQGEVEGGAYASRWVFMPAYSPTKPHAPLGKWRARKLFTTPGWANQRDFAQDVGAAVVGEVKGVRLTRKVGGQSVGFNLDRNQRWSAFGYPGEPPFDGERQWRCDSATHDIDAVTPGSPIRILCNMTAGVSGGGWFIDLHRGRGTLNSVASSWD